MAQVTGIVLAAGAGTRAGGPKVRRPGWLEASVGILRQAECDPVIAVLGAAIVPTDADIVFAQDWADGMSASLRAGLLAASGDAALITLVDLPGMPVLVALRVLGEPSSSSLRRAVYDGRPGHPVLIGCDHWDAVLPTLTGDRGAGRYLCEHDAELVECGDLWDGADVDR